MQHASMLRMGFGICIECLKMHMACCMAIEKLVPEFRYFSSVAGALCFVVGGQRKRRTVSRTTPMMRLLPSGLIGKRVLSGFR